MQGGQPQGTTLTSRMTAAAWTIGTSRMSPESVRKSAAVEKPATNSKDASNIRVSCTSRKSIEMLTFDEFRKN
jgi:hypothetical protein